MSYYKNAYLIALVETDEFEYIRFLVKNIHELARLTGRSYQVTASNLAHGEKGTYINHKKYNIELIPIKGAKR